MSDLILSIDIGSTNLKAVLFSFDGKQVLKASVPTQTHYPKPEWAEFDPAKTWALVAGLILELTQQLSEQDRIMTVSITGMAEAGVPLDKQGEPLYQAITWFDRRVLPQLDWWDKTVGAKQTATITGLPMAPMGGILRLLWLRDNHPELYQRVHCWLNLPEYIAYRLCGARVAEYSLASRMMVLDIGTKCWSTQILNAIDIDESLLGELVPSGDPVGKVHEDARKQTGLSIGLPVCIGGHDHLCASVGLGVTGEGDIFDSIGTAEAFVARISGPINDAKIAEMGIAQGIHVIPNSFYAITGNGYGGGSVDWAKNILLSQVTDGQEAIKALISLAEKAPVGSGGVLFLPHLRQANPPILDSHSKGAFVGLTSDNTTGDMARAVLEGLAYEYQGIIDAVNRAFGFNPQRLVAAGGGTRNPLLMQIKADLFGKSIVIPDVEEATCLGAAMIAGIGCGIYRDLEDAQKTVNFTAKIINPDIERHTYYRAIFEDVFSTLYQTLKKLNHTISTHKSIEH